MMKRSSLLIILSLLFFVLAVPAFVCALPIVCVPAGGDIAEVTAIQDSLAAMGYTLRLTDEPASSDCTVYVSHPGQSEGTVSISWVQAGNGVVQIGDWGPSLMPNYYAGVPEGATQNIEIVDAGHPITSGLPASWISRGFWAYGHTIEDYIGWATSTGDPNIVRAGGYDKALSAKAEGIGKLVYIGWNVYGPLATAEDLTILQQAINWAGGPGVAVQLTVNLDLPGGGTVKGGGINCPSVICSQSYNEGTKVTLTAAAKNSYKFRGWTGCDTPLRGKCTMLMTEGKEVTAKFTGIYSIAGRVVNQIGLPMANVTVTLESATPPPPPDFAGSEAIAADISRLVVTDAYGKYKFIQLPNGSYKVTPGDIGFTFTPLNQKVTIFDGHRTGVNFRLVY
ncbi:MAG: carboxypeptidase regulatory-like domain-containing protein [Nitrospirae bacterium]|nr:carboxypeptidase regulatory-like domain-containing protein [Nitrospirota bacterium]